MLIVNGNYLYPDIEWYSTYRIYHTVTVSFDIASENGYKIVSKILL
jgi:hypothetical protein